MPTGQKAFAGGQATTAKGLGDIGSAMDYWKGLLSGNRSQIQAAAAPEINAAMEQSDAARRAAAATGTSRGGGTAVAAQTAKDKLQSTVDNMLFGVRPAAAGEVGKLGTAESSIGLSEEQIAANILGLGEHAASDLTALAGQSRKTSYDINRQTQQDWANAIAGLLGAF